MMNKTELNNRRRVLILCTGNSCRSQMAEAVINDTLSDQWQAMSAGTQPADQVHPKALQVLEEIGISHDGEPRHTDHFRDEKFDLVITVCDSASDECPLWLGEGKIIHHSFIDPAEAAGTEDEIMSVFRQVRDEIAVQIPRILLEFSKK